MWSLLSLINKSKIEGCQNHLAIIILKVTFIKSSTFKELSGFCLNSFPSNVINDWIRSFKSPKIQRHLYFLSPLLYSFKEKKVGFFFVARRKIIGWKNRENSQGRAAFVVILFKNTLTWLDNFNSRLHIVFMINVHGRLFIRVKILCLNNSFKLWTLITRRGKNLFDVYSEI